jgi:hypothetical protein
MICDDDDQRATIMSMHWKRSAQLVAQQESKVQRNHDDGEAVVIPFETPLPTERGQLIEDKIHHSHSAACEKRGSCPLQAWPFPQQRKAARMGMLADMPMILAAHPTQCQVAPWYSLLKYILPLTSTIFVAGSAATWLAEHCLARQRPMWDPTDIDVFVLQRTADQYEELLSSITAGLKQWKDGGTLIRFSVIPKSEHITNIAWWVTRDDTEYVCPDLSLIRCQPACTAEDVINGFDLDICQVTVGLIHGRESLGMSKVVHQHLLERIMHCKLQPRLSELPFYFGLQKSQKRVVKYTARGYKLKQLTLMAATHCDLDINDFILHADE